MAAEGMRKLVVSNWPDPDPMELARATCRRWPELDAHKVSGGAPRQTGLKAKPGGKRDSFKNAADAKFSFPTQSVQEAR